LQTLHVNMILEWLAVHLHPVPPECIFSFLKNYRVPSDQTRTGYGRETGDCKTNKN